MTYAADTFMVRESHGSRGADRPRERLQTYLNRQYRGAHRRKALAHDIAKHGVPEVTEKTAENILNGHWPSDLHMAAIVRRFGNDVLAAVFAPEIEPVLARLAEEERQLEEELARIRARKRQAAGGLEGPSLAPAPAEGRAVTSKD